MIPKLFYLGESAEEFINDAGSSRSAYQEMLCSAPALDEDMRASLGKGFSAVRYVAVIAETWSGDVLYFLPPLLKMAQQMNWEVRIFRRSRYPEMILPYRKDGLYQSIPVFIFFDEDFAELGHWVERPAAATTVIEEESKILRQKLRETNKLTWQQETIAELVNLFHAYD